MQRLIFWELNEINFDYVNHYISKGYLPNWRKFLKEYGLTKTYVDEEYKNLEPWIQWPTIRTGKDFKEHRIFRLGDISDLGDIKQHWEIIENLGYSVAAISPINAINRTRNSPFWIPDPWVESPLSGDQFIKDLYSAIKQAVNENASDKVTLKTALTLLRALLTKTRISSLQVYAKCIFGVVNGRRWSRAFLLDRLLSDVFIEYFNKYKPDFSVLFLNAGAHIQHHYLFNSSGYSGELSNPNSYIKSNEDPLLGILKLYDEILKDLLKIEDVRLMIAVGIQQVPYDKESYYWRLRNHEAFLKKIGINNYLQVDARMTRDFLITFLDINDAKQAENILQSIRVESGDKIFSEIDNRGLSLFVTLTYPKQIKENFRIYYGNKILDNFEEEVSFVAIKNGMHDSSGYFFDTNRVNSDREINIKEIFNYVINHFKK